MQATVHPVTNVYNYHENWITKSKESEKYLDIQKLFEIVMIRSSSKATCKTVGSIMAMHTKNNHFLEPELLNMEIILRFNLGPLHILDGLIEEIFNSVSCKLT